MAVVARGMNDGKDDDRVSSHYVKDAIWKPSHQNAANVRVSAKTQKCKRILKRALDGRANFSGELQSQARLSAFVPDSGLGNVKLSLGTNYQSTAH
jgi:hypothetical protein